MPPLLLVVDDIAEIGLLVRRLGRHAGQEVIHHPAVETAWIYLEQAAASGRLPDLVLLDINLPGTSGVELCRRMRATPGLAAILVAVFGEWVRSADLVAGLDAGADFVVSKDLLTDPGAWQARLAEILRQADGRHGWPSVSWTLPATTPALLKEWVNQLNRCVQRCALDSLGADGLAILLRRVLEQAAAGREDTVTLVDEGLSRDRLELNAAALSRRNEGELVVRIARALTEQVKRLGGTAEHAALERAMQEAVPALAKILADS